MKLTIDNNLKMILPSFFPLAYKLSIKSVDEELLKKSLASLCASLKNELSLEDVVKDPIINETRCAYKTLKKDPSHTRPACEALLRQALREKINYHQPLVDFGNFLSLLTKRSTFVGDLKKINGDIFITIGEECDSYIGLGNRQINATNLIIYKDELGVIGSPTSDVYRSSVDDQTKDVLIMIMVFNKDAVEEVNNLFLKCVDELLEINYLERIN